MAGDWIKMDCSIFEKPEISKLAIMFEADTYSIVGKCLRIWIWFDQHTVDGNARGVTPSFIDALVCTPGFALALKKVNWLCITKRSMLMPNFERHCGKSAKNRALTLERVKRFRNAHSVTESLTEKRREEKNNTPYSPPLLEGDIGAKENGVQVPSLEEVQTFAAMQNLPAKEAEVWWLYRQGNGWPKGDWRFDLKAWVERKRSEQPWRPGPPHRLTKEEEEELEDITARMGWEKDVEVLHALKARREELKRKKENKT